MDVETLHDVEVLIRSSTPRTGSNIPVLFNPIHFKQWSNPEKYKPIPNIREQHMIRFQNVNGEVNTLCRQGYRGCWTTLGTMMKKVKSMPASLDLEIQNIPAPKLKDSRIEHIQKDILPHISDDKKAWWNIIASRKHSNSSREHEI